MYEEVDGQPAVAKHEVSPMDTRWIGADKAFEEEPQQVDQELLHVIALVGTGRDPSSGGLKERLSIVANFWQTFGIVQIDVSRAYLHTKVQRPVLVRGGTGPKT